jgi:hypothetical protein
METGSIWYGRCSGCHEIKHVAADGAVYAHNRYDGEGTSVMAVRCPGTGRPALAAPEHEVGAVARPA